VFAIRAIPQSELRVGVVDCGGWLPELSQRTAEIDRGSPLAHPFQTESFVALFNTDACRPHYAVIAEDGHGLADRRELHVTGQRS